MTTGKAKDYAIRGFRVSFLVAGTNMILAFTFPIIFISCQGKVAFGEYLALSAIPSLIVFAERGKIQSASVLMSKLHTRNDFFQRDRIFRLMIQDMSISALLSIPLLVTTNLLVHQCTIKHLIFSILICVSGYLNSISSCLEAYFRGIARFSQGLTLFTLARIIEFMGIVTGVILNFSLVHIVLTGLMGRIFGLIFQFLNYLNHGNLFQTGNTQDNLQVNMEYKSAAKANFAMSLGSILQNQLPILIIEKLLGLSLVSDFTIMKTFSGLFKTVITSVLSGANSATTISMERDDSHELSELRLLTGTITLVISLASFPLSLITYTIWCKYQGHFPAFNDYVLLTCFISGALVDGFFLRDMNFLSSTNHHTRIGYAFLISNFIAILLFILSLNRFGLFAYPFAFLFLDIILIPFSRKESIKLLNT